MTDMLIAETTHPARFANSAWEITKPAGTHVQVRAAAIESGRSHVIAYIPGTRYSTVLPVSMIHPV